jgi:hypothetical protein
MKYYMLTFDKKHHFVNTSLHRPLSEQQEISLEEWRQAGGQSLAGESPSSTLWGARPGLLLLDATLREPWIAEFGDRGLLSTTIGNTSMFPIVPPAASDGVRPDGHWREHQFFGTHLGPPKNQRWAMALDFDLSAPVVRQWDGEHALASLYSAEVVDWLRSHGGTGVSFTLVWDPARTVLPTVTEFHDHEFITL